MVTLKAPFPWFGGKSRVAEMVWRRLGADVGNYVEPFAGSLAVLLGRPGGAGRTETVNDADGYLSNFWRATAADPEGVAYWADWPVNENDLHARHFWLVERKADFVTRLEGDPEFFDSKVAGWWVWGLCSWIGSGWCSGKGPWSSVNGLLVNGDAGRGVNRQLPHLGNAGRGLAGYLSGLAVRLRGVRVACGDWSRVVGDSVTHKHGITGVFLDPPYSGEAGRTAGLYADDCLDVAQDAARWAVENGDNPLLRIAFCGYEGEHRFPSDWAQVDWKAPGGFGSQGSGKGRANSSRERIWFSPHCLGMKQQSLFQEAS